MVGYISAGFDAGSELALSFYFGEEQHWIQIEHADHEIEAASVGYTHHKRLHIGLNIYKFTIFGLDKTRF
jgi:hypothetical protein